MSAVHRVRQFARALRPQMAGTDVAAAGNVLSARQYALFARLTPADQRHALEVCRRLRAAGVGDAEVLQAALLHDVGKVGSGLGLWQRVAAVLLAAAAPAVLRLLAIRGPWRRAFGAYLRHPQRGARLARLAGSSARVVALIAAHQRGRVRDPALGLLRRADNA